MDAMRTLDTSRREREKETQQARKRLKESLGNRFEDLILFLRSSLASTAPQLNSPHDEQGLTGWDQYDDDSDDVSYEKVVEEAKKLQEVIDLSKNDLTLIDFNLLGMYVRDIITHTKTLAVLGEMKIVNNQSREQALELVGIFAENAVSYVCCVKSILDSNNNIQLIRELLTCEANFTSSLARLIECLQQLSTSINEAAASSSTSLSSSSTSTAGEQEKELDILIKQFIQSMKRVLDYSKISFAQLLEDENNLNTNDLLRNFFLSLKKLISSSLRLAKREKMEDQVSAVARELAEAGSGFVACVKAIKNDRMLFKQGEKQITSDEENLKQTSQRTLKALKSLLGLLRGVVRQHQSIVVEAEQANLSEQRNQRGKLERGEIEVPPKQDLAHMLMSSISSRCIWAVGWCILYNRPCDIQTYSGTSFPTKKVIKWQRGV